MVLFTIYTLHKKIRKRKFEPTVTVFSMSVFVSEQVSAPHSPKLPPPVTANTGR